MLHAASEHKLIEIAAEHIRSGRSVVFPTDTVYGLGVNALDPIAVAKVFELKRRPFFDPLIVHVSDFKTVEVLADVSDRRIKRLAEQFWPGPLTIILPKRGIVPDIVTSGLPTVGVRMPNHPVALELIRLSGCPIAAPSANLFQRLSPTTCAHVWEQIKNADYYLDAGPTKIGVESTIIKLETNGFIVLRHGEISAKHISDTIKCSELANTSSAINAPGMFEKHYQPLKPLYFTTDIEATKLDKSVCGIICHTGQEYRGYGVVIELSDYEDFRMYASQMFSKLHDLENSDMQYIIVEPVPLRGIGIAIMDRYRKAHY